MSRTYVVFLDTGVQVSLPTNVDPDSDEGYDALKKAAAAQFITLLQQDPIEFAINVEDDWGDEWKCHNCGHKDTEEEFVSTKHGDNDHHVCPKCGSEQVFNNEE